MTQSYPRLANVFGALVTSASEHLRQATEDADRRLLGGEPTALVVLAQRPGQSIDALSRALALTHSGAVRLVDRLEASGLVERSPSGRGRALALRLTRRGKEIAA